MAGEKMKEVREWLTFGLSLITVILIPTGYLILANQRLEIERDAADRFVDKASFNAARSIWDTGIGEVRGQLGSIQLQLQHQSDVVQGMKERFDSNARKAPP